MALNTEAFAAMAALDASTAYARAAQLAKSPEQILRDHLDGQIAAAKRFLKLAQEHRAWRRMTAVLNPGALHFYGDQVPVLMDGCARHRRAAREARAQLAALLPTTTQKKAA